ncbi:MAG: T9SS type A sorting domain-containing protein [Bacteroidetes bacterium]|nr:T9SS type A sorting domain-containing protein [Bacteroidota bacterium]MDA1119654.1 T9SS type A sorting domain-containing protein [Bacteroidota bacterium]
MLKQGFWYLIIGIMWAPQGFAQLTLIPIKKDLKQTNLRSLQTLQENDTIQLPFWDDFSQSVNSPNPELWVNSENIFINSSMGTNPPTLNVATFDGTDAFGVPYDINSDFVMNTDNLVSKAIDLSNIAANKQNTVFLSFFWQARGHGELPNEKDSMRLQFFDKDSTWVTRFLVKGGLSAIRKNINGEEVFTHEIFRVDGQKYFHKGFRFRFQSFGSPKGGFDSWHIDYVFLNQDRDFADLSFYDRGITGESTSIFGDYTAVSSELFFAAPSDFITPSELKLFNLDALPHPIEFTFNVRDLVNGILVDRPNDRTTANILLALERRAIVTNSPNLASLMVSDSIVLETEFIFNTGDNHLIQFINPVSNDTTFYNNVDYKVNDTLRRQFHIQDYLAYDDGTAEFAAGINQIRGQLAYEYHLTSQDTLTDIDIYFPKIDPASDGLPIEILVWKDLSGIVGSILAKQQFTIKWQEGINQFTRYTLEIPLVVADTIYIGWEQFSDNTLGVGFDKNTNSGDRIFVNVDGDWRQNVGLDGSLMLRPRFGRQIPSLVTGFEDDIMNGVKIYPNPSDGLFQITGDYDNLQLFDILGRSVDYRRFENTITLDQPKPGIYLARLIKNDLIKTIRIIVK